MISKEVKEYFDDLKKTQASLRDMSLSCIIYHLYGGEWGCALIYDKDGTKIEVSERAHDPLSAVHASIAKIKPFLPLLSAPATTNLIEAQTNDDVPF